MITNALDCIKPFIQTNPCNPQNPTLFQIPGLDHNTLADLTNDNDRSTIQSTVQLAIQHAYTLLETYFLEYLDTFWTFCPNESLIAYSQPNTNTTTHNTTTIQIEEIYQRSTIHIHSFYANTSGTINLTTQIIDHTNHATTLISTPRIIVHPGINNLDINPIYYDHKSLHPYSIIVQFTSPNHNIALPVTLHQTQNHNTHPITTCYPCQPCPITTQSQHYGLVLSINNLCSLTPIMCHIAPYLAKPLTLLTAATLITQAQILPYFTPTHITNKEPKKDHIQHLTQTAATQIKHIVKQLQPPCSCCLKPNPIHRNVFHL